MRIQIDVFSDVVCPWCYIGKRRLEAALRDLRAQQGKEEGLEVDVQWRPFELNPHLPEAGMDRAEYVARKFGARSAEIYARVERAGREEGIAFDFEHIRRQPNTAAAHQLIALARAARRQDEMVEALFRAYFLEGADLTSRDRLGQVAVRAGLPADRAQACLGDEQARQAVQEDERAAHDLGVEGVPFFVFNRRFAVSGAQSAGVLVRAIEAAVDAEAREREQT